MADNYCQPQAQACFFVVVLFCFLTLKPLKTPHRHNPNTHADIKS